MENLTNILIAFGSGSVVASATQYYFNERTKRKTLIFQEKKEAFVGLLEAYQNAAVSPSDKASKLFAYWQIRCELVCSDQTKSAIQKIVDTNGNEKERLIAHENLKKNLRVELRNSF